MKTTYTYDHYATYAEVTEILQNYASEYPDYCRLESLAKTREGREVWMLSVTKRETGDFEEKPAYGVNANIHAGEVTGTMAALYFLDTLFTNLEDAQIDWILSNFTVYCIPRITPDGAECYLTTPDTLRSINLNYPYGELAPGVQPKDLDHDGVIRQMRIKNPNGAFKIYEKDPRVMVKRTPDDQNGDFYDVFSEGVLEKYEGGDLLPATAKFGYDYNRNFPINWQAENVQKGAGNFPLQHPETKAIADFYAHKPNVCMMLNFHTSGGQFLFPPGHIHTKDAIASDIERWRTIGKIATKETGYPALNLLDDYVGEAAGSMGIAGDFDTFMSYGLGIMDFTCELWDHSTRAGHPESWPRPERIPDEEVIQDFLDHLKWLEENVDGEGWKDWTEFEHPQLGKVEIGGLDYKNTLQNPPKKFLPQEVEKLTRFLLRSIKVLPRLSFEQTTLTSISKGVYKVDTVLVNNGYLPTSAMKEAEKINAAKPIKVTFRGAKIISGNAEEEIGQLEGFSGTKAVYSPLGGTIASRENDSRHLSWVILGKPGDTISIHAYAPRAGHAETVITLKGE